MRRAWPILCLLAAGCAGYHVGPVNGVAAGQKSVQISLFQNKTFEPRLSEALALSLRRAVQQDGTYRLETRNDGDIIVTGTILRFQRSAVSFVPGDVVTPRDVELMITAHVTALEKSTGKKLVDAEVIGRSTIRVAADLDSGNRQAVPVIAEDLARNVLTLLAEGKW